jgi:hypothetical protein
LMTASKQGQDGPWSIVHLVGFFKKRYVKFCTGLQTWVHKQTHTQTWPYQFVYYVHIIREYTYLQFIKTNVTKGNQF